MELADLRDRFPALDGLLVQISGLLTRRRVLLAASDRVLSLAWWEQGEQRIINTDLPPDLCQGGVPLQREVLAELVVRALYRPSLSASTMEKKVGGDGGLGRMGESSTSRREQQPSSPWRQSQPGSPAAGDEALPVARCQRLLGAVSSASCSAQGSRRCHSGPGSA